MSGSCDVRVSDGSGKLGQVLTDDDLVLMILFYVLDGVNYLVNEFQCDPWNYAFGISERPLQGTERDSRFLRGYTREKLRQFR